jgi:hypothetical protein
MLVLALCALPRAAAAQPWAEAAKAGDYRTAADLLHPIVFDLHQAGQGDPVPARYLAGLYAHGRGVSRDPIVACALARLSDISANMNVAGMKDAQDYFAYQARIQESERFVYQHCGGLSEHERKVAGVAFGCLTFGIPESTVTVGGQTVWVALTGFKLAEGAEGPLLVDVGCPQRVARLRAVTIEPPGDAAPGVKARQFVEVLAWQVGQETGASSEYSLIWQMFELRGPKIEPIAIEPLYSVGAWSQTVLAPDFDTRLTVEMIRSGHVRWRLGGAPPKRGWIMLPDEEKR